MNYEVLNVKPVTRRIGAEISGIDLTRPLSNRQTEELKHALADHLVLFFRDQPITHEDHKRLGRAFGELAIHTGVSGLEDHPEVVAIHADEESKSVAGGVWHTDLSCNEEPPLGSILYLHTVPENGGDTVFASMYAAYDSLSPRMKAYLEGLTAVHDANPIYKALFPDLDKTYPCSTHPIVRTHPDTGRKLLFVNGQYTTRIPELPKPESDAILAFLFNHQKHPSFQVRFRWEPHSIAFWDNRSTLHHAVWDYFPEVRSGYRVTIAGDRVY